MVQFLNHWKYHFTVYRTISVCTTILSCHILNKKIHTYKNNYKNHYENIFPNGRIQLNNIS